MRTRAQPFAPQISIEPQQLIPRFLQHPAPSRALRNFGETYSLLRWTAMRSFTTCEHVRNPSRRRFPLNLSSSFPRFLQHPALAGALRDFRVTHPQPRRAVMQRFATREDVRDRLRHGSPSTPSGSSLAFPSVLRLHAALEALK
jgi:hypothetical protein